jgi:hypothetical protein
MSPTFNSTTGQVPNFNKINICPQITKSNFKKWFEDVLNKLADNPEAGLPMMMITLPLLERYLRRLCGMKFSDTIGPKFKSELRKIFPVLDSNKRAYMFWNVFRNGLLHQAALNPGKDWMGWIKHETAHDAIVVEKKYKEFWVGPTQFAHEVIKVINGNFSVFMDSGVVGPCFPSVNISAGSGDKGTGGGNPCEVDPNRWTRDRGI